MGLGPGTYLILAVITFVIPALIVVTDDQAWHSKPQ